LSPLGKTNDQVSPGAPVSLALISYSAITPVEVRPLYNSTRNTALLLIAFGLKALKAKLTLSVSIRGKLALGYKLFAGS